MMNPIQMIQAMKSGNPMEVMQSMLGGNPQFQRVMQMVNGKSPAEIKQIAMNLCNQSGVDFNAAVEQMRGMGIDLPTDEYQPSRLDK